MNNNSSKTKKTVTVLRPNQAAVGLMSVLILGPHLFGVNELLALCLNTGTKKK